MESIECSASFDSLNNKISISGLDTPLEIKYSEDIDFTQLVKYLCASLDTQRTINVQYPQNLSVYTDKEKIVLDTIKSIFNSFNEKVIQTGNNNLEFEPEVDASEDLPF